MSIRNFSEKSSSPAPLNVPSMSIGLLTGGDDKTYAVGLTMSLASRGIFVDYIGSTAVDAPDLHTSPLIHFKNLRGDQNENVGYREKITRILRYYVRLLRYATLPGPPIFHILWNNKFEFIDRTALMLYYRLMGKKVLLTVHNVNAAKRDSKDTWFNRATLGFQYRMADHLFVHTTRMKTELVADFDLPGNKISVIPFGINNIFPSSPITSAAARMNMGVRPGEKVGLFFGQIAPYKGLEYLISAMPMLTSIGGEFRLIIAGKVKRGCDAYWEQIHSQIRQAGLESKILERIQFIAEEEVEMYFKAADVLILPYKSISQSGVPFLAYSFGLPVLATDVGSLREDIVEGETGFVCNPGDPADLANKLEAYFSSALYLNLESRRNQIREFANDRYSWARVAEITHGTYQQMLKELH
jgi:glycosyltransferase involved in cell wall biosynthesis